MEARFSEIKNCKLLSVGGHIGQVFDLLTDDELWIVRYIAVDVKNTLPKRRVLIAPAAIADLDLQQRTIVANLSTQQLLESPPLAWNQPVSRQYEEALVEYYGWPIYWLGRAVQLPPQTLDDLADDSATEFVNECGSSNLRSAAEICGYKIKANNGPAGVMKDLVFRLDAWTVDYATAEPTSWLPKEGSKFSTQHIRSVNWSNREISVDLLKAVLEPDGNSANTPAIIGKPISLQPFRSA